MQYAAGTTTQSVQRRAQLKLLLALPWRSIEVRIIICLSVLEG